MLDSVIENHFIQPTFRLCQQVIQRWKIFRLLAFCAIYAELNFTLERSNSFLYIDYGDGFSLAARGLVYKSL
jgi:hypothetical protein